MSQSSPNLPAPAGGDFLLYRTEDGRTRIEVRFQGETVWLSLNQLADLFQRDKSVVSKHIKNVFDEMELLPESTVAKFATVQKEGNREVSREIEFYNLEVIISVGYRVKSQRGTQFRIWATQRLREFIIKGFTMDDERLKQEGGGRYFEELLARLRDIRSSEKVFWRKVLEIYATSIDYDPSAKMTLQFFQTVQNKMHWAVHGQTAAEVISRRVDAAKPNLGLTAWSGTRPRKEDVAIAKNYLALEELEGLNRIVTAYLEFAELQARNRKAMHMRDWIAKLDDFLCLTEHNILTHAGKVSHEAALAKAQAEYEKFRRSEAAKPSPVEIHFQEAIEQVKQLQAGKVPKRKPKP
jgi:hypothetical protein